AYQDWISELDEKFAAMIKHLIIDRDFEVRKVDEHGFSAEDGGSGTSMPKGIETTLRCYEGVECPGPCDHHPLPGLRVRVNRKVIRTSTVTWELRWVENGDLDRLRRAETMVGILQESTSIGATGLGKEAVKRLVRAASDVEA
ncbi:MAG: hypothetical protein Q9226_008536, partial [Calogaya cf. arnoldii]